MLATRGEALGGLSSAAAVSQAYDAACGLAGQASALRAALAGSCGTSCRTVPPPIVPPTERPGCAPCSQTPGVACPLVARPAYCVAGRDESAPRGAAAAAH